MKHPRKPTLARDGFEFPNPLYVDKQMDWEEWEAHGKPHMLDHANDVITPQGTLHCYVECAYGAVLVFHASENRWYRGKDEITTDTWVALNPSYYSISPETVIPVYIRA